MSSKDTLRNAIVFAAFERWVFNHKLPEYDSRLLAGALEEVKAGKKGESDVTLEGAIDRVKGAQNADEHPWIDVSQGIDWEQVRQEDELRGRAYDSAEVVKAALEAGLISPKDVELYRRPPSLLSRSEKANLQRRIEELEDKLKALEEKKRTEVEQPPTGTPLERTLREYVDKRLIEEQEVGGYIFTAQDKALLYSITNPAQTEEENKRRLDNQIRAMEELQKVGRRLAPVQPQLIGQKVGEVRVLGQTGPTQIYVGTREFFTDKLKARIQAERHTPLSVEEDKLLDLPLFRSVENNSKYFSHPERRKEQGYPENLRDLVKFYIERGELNINDLRIIGLADWFTRS